MEAEEEGGIVAVARTLDMVAMLTMSPLKFYLRCEKEINCLSFI